MRPAILAASRGCGTVDAAVGGNGRSAAILVLAPRLTWPITNESAWTASQGTSRMQADAYRRARKLLSSRRDYVIARVLGFVQSLLIVALLGVIALFVALLSSRGEARFPASKASLLPAWVVNRETGEDQQYLLFDDTGIFPLIADNLRSRNPIHRAGAAMLGWTAEPLPGASITIAARS